MPITVEFEIEGKKHTAEFKRPLHYDRRNWLLTASKMDDKGEDVEELFKFLDFREKVVLRLKRKSTYEFKTLGELPAKVVDKIFAAVEGDMDFRMGMRMPSSSLPLKEPPSTEKQAKSTSK